VLLALGLMLTTLWLTGWLGPGTYAGVLGSGALLMLGYATRFIAEVFAPLRDAFSAIDERQIDSARALGARPLKRLRTVVLPAVSPGLAVAAMIGFNAIVKELPVTLLLGGATGLKTLSFRVWDRYNESLWHDAGVAGLLLVALALTSAVFTHQWRRNG
jgi:iron(III) transport system permease protein